MQCLVDTPRGEEEEQSSPGERVRGVDSLSVLFVDEHVLVLDKPSGLRTVPGIESDSTTSKAQTEWHCGTKRSRQEFWTHIVHDTCSSLLNEVGSSAASPEDEADTAVGDSIKSVENRGRTMIDVLRRLAGDHNVPRRKYTSKSLGLEGQDGDGVAEKLWSSVAGRLKREVGPGTDCLLNRVFTRWPGARHVHRLDQDTSGVVVMALTAEAARDLSQQFVERDVSKTYTAVLEGRMANEPSEGEVSAKLRASLTDRPRQVVDEEGGKSAITMWKVLSREEDRTRVEFKPTTGRTHQAGSTSKANKAPTYSIQYQLRVHAMILGHAILGDTLYATKEGRDKSARLLLHAQTLSFTHVRPGA